MLTESLPPVFVLGCPRSGTTLLGGLLGPTPWGCAVETHFIQKYYHRASSVDLSLRDNAVRVFRDIIAERPIRQWNIQWDEGELFGSCPAKDYADLVDRICLQRSRKLGLQGWADKTPHYSFDPLLLKKLFPDAKFVFIYRDGRDVAASLLKRPWGPNNAWSCARYWSSCCNALQKAARVLEDQQLFSIQYEQLLAAPVQTLHAMYEFLEVSLPTVDASRITSKVRRDNSGNWRQNLKPQQIAVFEAVAGDTLTKLGYELSTTPRPTPPLAELTYRLHDRGRWGMHMFRQNVIDGILIRYFGKQPFAE